jgi:hypothetical protein
VRVKEKTTLRAKPTGKNSAEIGPKTNITLDVDDSIEVNFGYKGRDETFDDGWLLAKYGNGHKLPSI